MPIAVCAVTSASPIHTHTLSLSLSLPAVVRLTTANPPPLFSYYLSFLSFRTHTRTTSLRYNGIDRLARVEAVIVERR